MAVRTNNNKTYYINPSYLTFVEDSGYGENLIRVSASSSCYITVYDTSSGIGYNDADKNYKKWKVTAYNNKFPDSRKYNIYVRLERNGSSALVVYSTNVLSVNGGVVTTTTDENGVENTVEGDADKNYYYINIGSVNAPVSGKRSIVYDTGYLESDQGYEESSLATEMFTLDKYVTPWLIRAKQWFGSFTVKGVLSVVGEIVFRKGDDVKSVSDIKRSFDSEVPVDDNTIPTTKYVSCILEDMDDKFLSKQHDDRSAGKIASDKGFEVGDFNEGTLGSGAATFMRDGRSYSEVDFLKVRKKATFTNITIQELKYVGGEIVLSPAAMVVSKVEELEDGYKCYFDTTDYDGRKVYSYFEVGDQAKSQTFNLEQNQYYWRLVTEVNEDDGYIVLSKTDCDKGSGIPKEGDNISQLGNRTDSSRQSAIILSAYGSDAPSYKQYSGVGATEPYFSLDGKQVTRLSPYGNELTGVLTIEKGSTGWQNFDGLPEEIQKAASAAENLEGLEYGKNNLLRNSGFTGDYLTAVLDGSTNLKDTSSMFSPSLKYWEAVNATAQESTVSESGKEVFIADGGSISQTLYFKIIKGEKYIFSFKGRGGVVSLSVGGYTYQFNLTESWEQYVTKFTSSIEGEIFTLRVTGDCTLCELQLERGTVKSAWGISPLDNRSELAKYESLTYLANALKGETTTLGGLINTGFINMGTFNDKCEMEETTAGISGIRSDDNSVAYFAGGDYNKAIYTVATYLDNPNYVPTKEELDQMAKYVVTHGGRAILNDIILRGYIYALGGVFKGSVDIADRKIQLNEDGSGILANGSIWWTKEGLMFRKAHDSIVWTSIHDYENGIVDFSKGTYLDILTTMGYLQDVVFNDGLFDNMTVTIKCQTLSRRAMSATLVGNFAVYESDGLHEIKKLSLERGIQMADLNYMETQGFWYYHGTDYIIENDTLIIGTYKSSS